ncbi:glycosyltransferase family 2 protein [Polynucleobacter paneuropaeus]|nr:glycosyltransferase family 2 protein [Polynucleobacter paneuropaeus]
MIMNNTCLSIVVPVYNEENNIAPFLQRVKEVIARLGVTYEIIFAMDPSRDATEEVINDFSKIDENIKLITFSRRFGQPASTMAGIFNSSGEYCVVIDVDLQDPPEIIAELYEKILEGYDVVYAKRRSRSGETSLKKMISSVGYWLINKFSEINIPRDTGDFRIFNRKIINYLSSLKESHGFLRGLIAFIGFRQSYVLYDRDPRFSGHGKYNRITGSLKIGLNGLISFSSTPLQVMSIIGFILAIFSFLFGLYVIFAKLVYGSFVEGFATLAILITFLSGIQMLFLGIMGEYISRIYDEVKERPLYIIDKKINFKG